LQPAKKGKRDVYLKLEKRFKINIAEAKKVCTFAVPKQTGAFSEKDGSNFRTIKYRKSNLL
jgi:hypothetical protein